MAGGSGSYCELLESGVKAPGYNSWAWTTQDWRVVVPNADSTVRYDERCGGASNRTPGGRVRLCLPLAVIQKLDRTQSGREILHQQATRKQRATPGARVAWHPKIKALWRLLEAKTPADAPRQNPAYAALPLPLIDAFEPLAERWGVSKVARGKERPELRGDMPRDWPRSFMLVYRRAGGRIQAMPTWWQEERRRFIARHMAQVRKRGEALWRSDGLPTRRHLALIFWAYSPEPDRLRRLLRRS